MSANVAQILRLEVPIIVQMGEKVMTVGEVLAIVPGTIIELPRAADCELDLLVNNRHIGSGNAVKVGENFGVEISSIGDVKDRIAAMGSTEAAGTGGTGASGAGAAGAGSADEDLEALAAQMLAGQL